MSDQNVAPLWWRPDSTCQSPLCAEHVSDIAEYHTPQHANGFLVTAGKGFLLPLHEMLEHPPILLNSSRTGNWGTRSSHDRLFTRWRALSDCLTAGRATQSWVPASALTGDLRPPKHREVSKAHPWALERIQGSWRPEPACLMRALSQTIISQSRNTAVSLNTANNSWCTWSEGEEASLQALLHCGQA